MVSRSLQQKIGGQISAHFALVIVEADHVDTFVGLEFVGLLGQERQLDGVAQVGVGHAADRVGEAEPLFRIQGPIAQVLKILDGEFMAQEGGLALQTGDDEAGIGYSELCKSQRSAACLRFAYGQFQIFLFKVSL